MASKQCAISSLLQVSAISLMRLSPSPSPSPSSPSLQQLLERSGVPVLESLKVIINIKPRRYSSQLDFTQDYSYLDAPVRDQDPGENGAGPMEGEVVLRFPTANYRIPAYIGNNLAWGSPPKAAEALTPGVAGLRIHPSYGVRIGVMRGIVPSTDPTAAEGSSGAIQLPPLHFLSLYPPHFTFLHKSTTYPYISTIFIGSQQCLGLWWVQTIAVRGRPMSDDSPELATTIPMGLDLSLAEHQNKPFDLTTASVNIPKGVGGHLSLKRSIALQTCG
eukprot:gene20550-27341_t